MVKRLGSFVAVMLIAIFALAACGTPDEKVEPTVTRIPNPLNAPVIQPTAVPGSNAPAPTVPSAGEPVTLDLQLEDIKFDKTELDVPANTQVTINIKNSGASTHNFNIDDLNVHSGDVQAGGTATVTFNSGPAGSHEYYCNIPGHKEAGMDGKLVVSEGSGEAAPAATQAGAAAPTQASAPAAQTTFDVQLKDIAFDVTEITVPENSQITINLTNAGASTHNFNIDALNVHSGDIQAGGKTTVTFNSGAAAEDEYYCNIPGHKEAGMVGKLHIVAGGASSPGSAGQPASPAPSQPSPTAQAQAPAQATPAAGAGSPPTTFDLQLKDIAFSVKELDVPANTQITINITNAGAATHNFNIDDLNVHSGDVPAGGNATVTFNSGPAGTHQYYCNIPGHKEAGMVGQLKVVEGGASVPAASPAASPAVASPAAASQTTFDLELKDIAFSVKSIDVPANTQITINIKNVGAATHNFNIDELNVHSGDVAAGASTTVTFNSGPAGSFTYYCNIPGHKEAGMIGKITSK
jgi:uncharacterized cupredoxin-like copper-binding protein